MKSLHYCIKLIATIAYIIIIPVAYGAEINRSIKQNKHLVIFACSAVV